MLNGPKFKDFLLLKAWISAIREIIKMFNNKRAIKGQFSPF